MVEVGVGRGGGASVAMRVMGSSVTLWELRDSVIHQQGMFARVDIPAGTKIIEYFGERVSKEESLRRCLAQEAKGGATGGPKVFIFDVNEEWDLDGDIPDNPAKFINHSCEENCQATNEDDRIWIVASKDIPRGAELTFDYGYDRDHYQDHPCRCGSRRCVGFIVAKHHRRALRAELEAARKAAEKAARAAERAARRQSKAAAKAGLSEPGGSEVPSGGKKAARGKRGAKKATSQKAATTTLSKKAAGKKGARKKAAGKASPAEPAPAKKASRKVAGSAKKSAKKSARKAAK